MANTNSAPTGVAEPVVELVGSVAPDVATELRRRRELLGWSQAETARRSGISRTVVNEIESGRRVPEVLTYEKLRAALGLAVPAAVALLRRAAPEDWSERQLATLAGCLVAARGGTLSALADALGVAIPGPLPNIHRGYHAAGGASGACPAPVRAVRRNVGPDHSEALSRSLHSRCMGGAVRDRSRGNGGSARAIEAGAIYTVGHSTRSLDELVAVLQAAQVEWLIDVRTVPRSRRNPQFARDLLAHSLPEQGVTYSHEAALGGFRRTRVGSPNSGWHEKAFRGYADYMESTQFRAALERLTAHALQHVTCLMCAEAQWWRCHRRLISDALVVRGWSVRHLGLHRNPIDHELTPFAVVGRDHTLTYPAA